MTRPKILVTGATGKTGGAVATQLLAAGWPIRAIVRAQDARSEALGKAGAEIVVADMYDPEQLLAAMRGTVLDGRQQRGVRRRVRLDRLTCPPQAFNGLVLVDCDCCKIARNNDPIGFQYNALTLFINRRFGNFRFASNLDPRVIRRLGKHIKYLVSAPGGVIVGRDFADVHYRE